MRTNIFLIQYIHFLTGYERHILKYCTDHTERQGKAQRAYSYFPSFINDLESNGKSTLLCETSILFLCTQNVASQKHTMNNIASLFQLSNRV